MAGRKTVFRAEGWTERVHVAKRHGKDFRVQLSGNRKRHGLGKEILGIIHLSFRRAGRIRHVQRGYLEHFACAFAIAAGDQGRVHIQKALVMEETMDGLRGDGTHPKRALEQVCPGPQMLNGAQIFQRMTFFLQRIIRRAVAKDGHAVRLQFKGLLHAGGDNQGSGNFQGSAHVQRFHHIPVIMQLILLNNDLQVFETTAVVDLHERKGLAFPRRAYPAADRNVCHIALGRGFIQRANKNLCHDTSSFHKTVVPKSGRGQPARKTWLPCAGCMQVIISDSGQKVKELFVIL